MVKPQKAELGRLGGELCKWPGTGKGQWSSNMNFNVVPEGRDNNSAQRLHSMNISIFHLSYYM